VGGAFRRGNNDTECAAQLSCRDNKDRDHTMSGEDFNMSLRKFLKQVGVTSQQQIEELVRAGNGGNGKLKVKAVLTAEGTALNHVVVGEIDLP
jgi:hypothetical protein